jgi:23S rRNA pseudouridine1911/1915/1917 synthase
VSTGPPFSIRYEDEHLLVVDKAAGLVVHPARGHSEQTLSQLLAPWIAPEDAGRAGDGDPSREADEAGWDPARPGIVHRLDRDTSGLLVVARTRECHRRLQRALARRAIEREYLALVEGRPPARTGTIEAPIGRDARVRTRMAVGGVAQREARTHFTLERALPDTSLLRLRLETGRTHQIRVHLRAIGHPVCGDPEYGTPGRLGLRRQFLHATRIAFDHPITGARVDVSSPLPEDLRDALARAERLS